MKKEDTEKLVRALNGLADVVTRKDAELEKERKHQKEREERRQRLYKVFYEEAPAISCYIPQDSALIDEEDTRNMERVRE